MLRLRLAGEVLSAANTGQPLTADAVVGLSTLRASAKRGGRTVGRFGVGFAAVAAVSDEVEVRSTSGSVRFSRALTAEAVAGLPSLAGELATREGRVPLLRLPFASAGRPPEGFDTEVRVVVRAVAVPAVAAALAGIDPTLLLVLPGLSRLEIDDRVLTVEPDGPDVVVAGVRWRVVRREGVLDPALLAGRPVEERAQTRWSVLCAVPVTAAGVPLPLPDGIHAVVRAPTPTDDPLSLPALIAASLPLGPDRRRVAPGPPRDAVLGHVADALVELVEGLADDPARLRFVPGPLGAGEVDAALGSAVLQAFRVAPVLAGARLARDAMALEGATPDLVELLGDLLPGVLPHEWSGLRWAQPLRALGVRRIDLAELTEVLAGIDRPAAWWGRLYAALPPDADQLGALPVPLTLIARANLAASTGLFLLGGLVGVAADGVLGVVTTGQVPQLVVAALAFAVLATAAGALGALSDDPSPLLPAGLSIGYRASGLAATVAACAGGGLLLRLGGKAGPHAPGQQLVSGVAVVAVVAAITSGVAVARAATSLRRGR